MRNKIFLFAFLISASAFFAGAAEAQDIKAPDAQAPAAQHDEANRGGGPRFQLLHSLGLSTEQIQQIRQIDLERKPLMDEAQKHLRQATRALDAAIYAEQVNDADVDLRLKDVQTAQAEVSRIRIMNELAVRKVLTPEQLARFIEMRQRFERARQNLRDSRQPDGHEPRRGRGHGRGGSPADQKATGPPADPQSQPQ